MFAYNIIQQPSLIPLDNVGYIDQATL